MQLTRRQVLKQSLAATASCGLAHTAIASNSPAETIIDTHVYIGHWPHKRLSGETPGELIAELQRNKVGRAWIGSFDGLFHKDIAAVNQRLADLCTRHGDRILIPFGTINPMLPDWEEDVRRCREVYHMPGIRLHPNYHGYTLDDARFGRLLELAGALVVQVVAWMDDKLHRYLNPLNAHVDLKPLAEKVAPHSKLRLVVAGGVRSVDDSLRSLSPRKQIYFDAARAARTSEVRRIVDAVGIDRVVFGSGGPLHEFRSAWAKMEELPAKERETLGRINAERLVP